MRAKLVSTGPHFCVGQITEGRDEGNEVHLPMNRLKKLEFRHGLKTPSYAGRHTRLPKSGEVVEIMSLSGELRQEKGKLIYPSATNWCFADEYDFMLAAGPGGVVESYSMVLEVADYMRGDTSTSLFTGSLAEIKDRFPRSKDSALINSHYQGMGSASLRFGAKLKGKETFISCPDPRLWTLPAAVPANKPNEAVKQIAPLIGYYVFTISLDPVTLNEISDRLAEGVSEEEYREKFYAKLDYLVRNAMSIQVFTRNNRTGEIRFVYARFNPNYAVRPQAVTA